MTHYSREPSHVRVDFFKDNGKWYTTEQVDWTGGYFMDERLIQEAFAITLFYHLKQDDGSFRLTDMWAVCLDPYYDKTFPQMVRVKQAIETAKLLPVVPAKK